jgi:hypothetical protein
VVGQFCAICELLCCSADGSLPAKQKKVVTAQRAPIGLEKPVDSFLQGVSHANTSKIDRPAVGAVGEFLCSRADHNLPYASAFAGLRAAAPDCFRMDGIAPGASEPPRLPPAERPASLAAVICSGVRTSGSDSFTCSFARATCRLWRFSNRLFNLLPPRRSRPWPRW